MREANLTLRGNVDAFARTDANRVGGVLSDFINALDQAAKDIKNSLETRKMWAGVEELGERLRNLRSSRFAEEIAVTIADQLSRFSDAYEAFVRTYSRDTTLALLVTGNDLYLRVDAVRTMAVLVEKELGPTISASEGEGTLDIVISSATTASELAEKVEALVRLYEKLSELLSVSTASNPLRIAKVESGSLWLNLIGQAAVIKVMSSVLMAVARYMYRALTSEGKIRELPRRVEALEAILELRKELQAQGINAEEMDESIQKGAVALSQQAQTLLAGESKIVINATEIGVQGERRPPELTDRERPLLGDSSDNDQAN